MRHRQWQGREPIRRVADRAEAEREAAGAAGEAADVAYDIDDWPRRRRAAPRRKYVIE